MRRQKIEPGAIVKIRIDDKTHTYARALSHPFVAIYDCRTEEDIDEIAEIISRPILFIVAVFDRAIRSGRWRIVGKVSSKEDAIQVPDRFMQNVLNPNDCQIIDARGSLRNATPEECEGLEREAIWEADHVQERIRDHYSGRKNIHLEYMKVKR